MDRDDRVISRFVCDPGTEHKVVDERELQSSSNYGYSLVAVFYEDIMEQAMDSDTVPVVDPHNIHYVMRTDVTSKVVHHVVRQARYLVRRDPETALAQKHQELVSAQGILHDVRQALDVKEKSVTALTKEKVELQAKVDRIAKDYKAASDARDTVQETKRKLEGDIAKIRVAIGEKQMREILGG